MPILPVMMEYVILFKDWVIALGEKHGVDPLLLGCLYLFSKLCFFSFLGWVIKNLRAKKPFVVPLLFAAMSFSIPYLYLIIAGRNISVWVIPSGKRLPPNPFRLTLQTSRFCKRCIKTD
jgi:hypothetical protein